MSNTITNRNAASSQPQSWLGRIGRAFKEAFSTPEAPVQRSQTGDHFVKGKPMSESLRLRLASQNAGRGSDGTRGANGHVPGRDTQLIAYLNHISLTGDPTPPEMTPARPSTPTRIS
jgi:hypothetical protein